MNKFATKLKALDHEKDIEYRKSVDRMRKYIHLQRYHIQMYISGEMNYIDLQEDSFTRELKLELDNNMKFRTFKNKSWKNQIESLITTNLANVWIAINEKQNVEQDVEELYQKYVNSDKDMDDLCARYEIYLTINNWSTYTVDIEPFELRFIYESCNLKLVRK